MTAPSTHAANSTPPVDQEKVNDKMHVILSYIFEGGLILVMIIGLCYLVIQKREAPLELITPISLGISNISLLVGLFFAHKGWANSATIVNSLTIENEKLASTIELNETESQIHQSYVEKIRSDGHSLNTEISNNRMQIAYAHTQFCADIIKTKDGHQVDINLQLKTYLTDVLNFTCHLFSQYTGKQCAACIKIFEGGFGDQSAQAPSLTNPKYVRTLLRDSVSNATRSAIDKKLDKFDYNKNTAFLRIYSHSDDPDYYVENDLRELAAQHKFHNAREKWLEDYDATAVVPIRPHGDPVEGACIGFLCVDNIGGNFDHDRCVNILNGVASDLYFGITNGVSLLKASS